MTDISIIAKAVRDCKARILLLEEAYSSIKKLGNKPEMESELHLELEQMKADLAVICPNDPQAKHTIEPDLDSKSNMAVC